MNLFMTSLLIAGNADAQRLLEVMYRQGQGGAKDAERALYWTQQAVAQGDAPAQFNLANMYETSDTVARNIALAAKHYLTAARAGIPLAQYRLGAFFLEGQGGVRDPVLAQDAALDLALLKPGAKFKRFATFRDGGIRKGETVVVAGFPLPGLLASDLKITTGTVSGRAGPGNNKNLIQLSRRRKRAIAAGRSWICRAMWSAW